MVVNHNFKELFDISCKTAVFNLPVYKENPIKIEFGESDVVEPIYNGEPPLLPFAKSAVFHANIIGSRRLTALNEACKDVYEITFDVTNSNIQHQPGDTIGIIPQNMGTEVEQLLSFLDLKAQAEVPYKLNTGSIKGAKIPTHIPVQSTLRFVLTNCLDLRSVIKKLFILALSRHTKEENERKVLEYLSSKEGSTAYITHILNKNLCILDLLSIFPSCKPTIEVLLSNLPRLLPRPYSIVNSGMKDPNKIKICFSVIDVGNNKKGLTTGWLENMILDSNLEDRIKNLSISRDVDESVKIPIYLRKNVSGFAMPKNLDTPLLLLGPGTGVAPFIGFLEERLNLKQNYANLCLGETWLLFGCRDPKLDFIYEKELNEFVTNGSLNKLTTAFSRVGDGPKYIQDAITENGDEVAKFLKKGASVFICGDLNSMASQIKEVLVQSLVKYDGKSQEEAEKYLADMQRQKRYFVDVWS